MNPQSQPGDRLRGTEVRIPSFSAVCSEFLSNLGLAVRMTGLYGATHPIAADAMREACSVLDLAFVSGRQEALQISLVNGRWLCNGAPLLAAVGWLIPGILAADAHRQGPCRTLGALAAAALLVRMAWAALA